MATLYAYSPNGTQATLSYSVIGFTQSLKQNGWCKLPNGLILQWGDAGGNNGGDTPVTFPIGFTTAVYNIQLTWNSNAYQNPQANSITTTTFSYWTEYSAAKWWLAIGE